MVMPPLHALEAVAVTPDGTGWRWTDAEGRNITLSTEGEALRLDLRRERFEPGLAVTHRDNRNVADP